MQRHRLANRDEELGLFAQIAAGESRERILLLEAQGGLGKTTLLAEFARCCPEGVTLASVDLKGSPGLHEVLARLCDALGWGRLPAFATAVERLARESAGPAADLERFPHVHREAYDPGAVHDLLADAFSVAELRRFLRYRLPLDAVLGHVGGEASLEDLIEALVEHCRQHVRFSDLLLAVREARFAQYKRHYARVYGGPAPEPRAPAPGEGLDRAGIEAALRAPDEGGRATRRSTLTRALFEDLRDHPSRLVILFDTYDQAGPEVQDWLAGTCLAHVGRTPPVAAVVAGREVPEESVEFAAFCLHRRLRGLREPALWQQYAKQIGAMPPDPAWIAGFCDLFDGSPLKMMEALARYVPGGGRP